MWKERQWKQMKGDTRGRKRGGSENWTWHKDCGGYGLEEQKHVEKEHGEREACAKEVGYDDLV